MLHKSVDRFDELNLEQGIENRRIALFCIENFYAVVMATIGEEALNYDRNIYEMNLSKQWDSVIRRLEDVLDSDERKKAWKYGGMVENDVKNDRDNSYHNFERGVGKEKLEEYREKAPEMRRFFLEKGEKYHEMHGAYSKKEYTKTKESVENAALKPVRYPWACKILRQELEYVEKVVLKQDGQAPTFIRDTGSHAYLGGFIDKEQFKKINRVVNVAEEDYKHLSDEKGEKIVDGGLDVLGFLYRSLNPYHTESLLTTKFVDAVEESGFSVTRTMEAKREVWIDHVVRFDGVVMKDGGLILRPQPDGVSVLGPYFSRKEIQQRQEDQEESLQRWVRKRDELDGEEILLVWNRRVDVDDEGIQEAFEGHWPPEDTG